MPPIAIQVENVSKRYILGHKAAKGEGLRHAIERGLSTPIKWARRGFKRDPVTREEFWALRDVSFTVHEGEVVGIIGRNGAGKSTLLKVLSRITEQTEGRIRLRGRLASLLEVGTGFHPELSGRENIFLNGAILGMGREEIRAKFDEIVAFAEVERFLDTPVKRYSSGMYVRLAFAVAAHLEPEILVVDEVLAVGDMAFQRKCLGKMDDVAKQGRTVLFVSHNMATIAHLCTRAIMLQQGRMIDDGPTDQVIARYLNEGSKAGSIPLSERTDRIGNGCVRLEHIELRDGSGQPTDHPASVHTLRVRVHYRCAEGAAPPRADLILVCKQDEILQFVLANSMCDGQPIQLGREGYIDIETPELPLAAGMYVFEVICASPGHKEAYDALDNALHFEVIDGDYFGSGKLRPNMHWRKVGVLTPHRFEHHAGGSIAGGVAPDAYSAAG